MQGDPCPVLMPRGFRSRLASRRSEFGLARQRPIVKLAVSPWTGANV